MGVQGLWTLLEPVGKRVNVETLQNRKVAVDASIWLIQFLSAMRDEKGELIRNAHVMGFFRRICRLLFHKIRPVFVFDGATPVLKQATVAARRRRREQHGSRRMKNIAERMLRHAMKKSLERGLLQEQEMAVQEEAQVGIQKPQQKEKEGKEEEKAPEKELGVVDEGQRADKDPKEVKEVKVGYEEDVEEISDDDDDIFLLPDDVSSVDPTVLGTLPPSIQLEVMEKMREHKTMENRDLFNKASAPSNFSQLQLDTYLKSCSFRKQMDGIKKKMNDDHGKGKRIASEQNSEYILKQFGSNQGNSFILGGGESSSNPILLGQETTTEKPAAVEVPETKTSGPLEIKVELGPKEAEDLSSEDMFESDGTSSSDVEWEAVDEDLPAFDGKRKAENEAPLHWRQRASQRQKFWSRTHGFQFGRKLGDWSEQNKDSPEDVKGGPSGREIEDYELAKAIELSQRDVEGDKDRKEADNNSDSEAIEFIDVDVDDPREKHEEVTAISVDDSDLKSQELEEVVINEEGTEIELVEEADGDIKKGEESIIDSNEATSIEPKQNESHAANPAGNEQIDALQIRKEDHQPIEECGGVTKKVRFNANVVAAPEEDLVIGDISDDKEETRETLIISSAPREDEHDEPSASAGLHQNHLNSNQVGSEMSMENPVIQKEQMTSKACDSQKETDSIEAPERQYQRSEINRDSIEKELNIVDEDIEKLTEEYRRSIRYSDEPTPEMYAECQELLTMFGIPYIIAPMEAEAQCAYLEKEGLVDGIVTDDGDAFLFGAQNVYRNIFESKKYVEEYRANDIERELGLKRENLIELAMLLGSDYTEGVFGVGIVNACEIIGEFPGIEGLRRFRDWVERATLPLGEDKDASDFMTRHSSVRKNWDLPKEFPNERVMMEYRSPKVDVSKDKFRWGKPDLKLLLAFCAGKFSWSHEKTNELLEPVLQAYEATEMQTRLEAFYGFKERFAKFKSERIKKAVMKLKEKANT